MWDGNHDECSIVASLYRFSIQFFHLLQHVTPYLSSHSYSLAILAPIEQGAEEYSFVVFLYLFSITIFQLLLQVLISCESLQLSPNLFLGSSHTN